MSDKLLPGVRVLDLSRVLAGPWCGQLLADYGAEVIKVERPGVGDDSRRFGPPFLKDRDGNDTYESPMFVGANRNKKSITVNLSKPEGQDLIRRLAAQSDIFLENYKVGDLARYGLDYASLKAVNPRLIYCSVTGFGQTGPYSHRPGYDTVFQAMGGLMSVTGQPDEAPGGGPLKTGVSITDVIGGLYATSAILAALHHRDQVSEQGQFIDLSLLDTSIAAMSHYAATYLVSGTAPIRRGNEGNGGMPSDKFEAADGPFVLVTGNDEQWLRLCEVLDCMELTKDPRFLRNPDRVANRRELLPILGEYFKHWKRDDILAALDKTGVPSGPIYDLAQTFADPHVQHRGHVVEVPHPLSGTVKLAKNPVHFSDTPIEDYVASPTLGQHTDEILGGVLGLSAGEIDQLRQTRII